MQKNKVLVSVIIPFCNGSKFLKEAINSVLLQNFTKLEIILVDDGSTDNSIHVLNEISDQRIRLVQQVKSGAAQARNNGVRHAKGEYIAFLDADDTWEINKLTLQMEVITAPNGPNMVFGKVSEFYDYSIPQYQNKQGAENTFVGYSPIAILISKKDFLDVGEFYSKWKVAEFIDWYARAKHAGLVETILPNIVANRRIHLGNLNKIKNADSKQYAAVLKEALDRRRNIQQ